MCGTLHTLAARLRGVAPRCEGVRSSRLFPHQGLLELPTPRAVPTGSLQQCGALRDSGRDLGWLAAHDETRQPSTLRVGFSNGTAEASKGDSGLKACPACCQRVPATPGSAEQRSSRGPRPPGPRRHPAAAPWQRCCGCSPPASAPFDHTASAGAVHGAWQPLCDARLARSPSSAAVPVPPPRSRRHFASARTARQYWKARLRDSKSGAALPCGCGTCGNKSHQILGIHTTIAASEEHAQRLGLAGFCCGHQCRPPVLRREVSCLPERFAGGERTGRSVGQLRARRATERLALECCQLPGAPASSSLATSDGSPASAALTRSSPWSLTLMTAAALTRALWRS